MHPPVGRGEVKPIRKDLGHVEFKSISVGATKSAMEGEDDKETVRCRMRLDYSEQTGITTIV
jgi:hypothetical protein